MAKRIVPTYGNESLSYDGRAQDPGQSLVRINMWLGFFEARVATPRNESHLERLRPLSSSALQPDA